MQKKDFSKVITFDGTSGSGKGTIARQIAKHYNYTYLDTGKLYRAFAMLVIEYSYQENYGDYIQILSKKINPDLFSDADLYHHEVTQVASKIAKDGGVRDALFDFQRDFVLQHHGVVLDGRDTGSVICPEAKHKFYVDGDLNIRVQRRYEQNIQLYGESELSISAVERALGERDYRDKNRDIAPLIVPEGAHIIDNSHELIEVVVKKIIDIIDYSA